jgi:hypothetical protein
MCPIKGKRKWSTRKDRGREDREPGDLTGDRGPMIPPNFIRWERRRRLSGRRWDFLMGLSFLEKIEGFSFKVLNRQVVAKKQ